MTSCPCDDPRGRAPKDRLKRERVGPGRAACGNATPEDEGALTIVDAGVPTSWNSLQEALGVLAKRRTDVRALILTHAHFDHIGCAERARTELGISVYVHENDVPLTRHPLQHSHERPRSLSFATQVQALPIVTALVRTRAFWPPPIGEVRRFSNGSLDVPGRRGCCSPPVTRSGTAQFTFPTAMSSSAATRS